ncbi:putative serine/threonine-protein kinase [Aphis craccivora]|uniref:Putative serine/threonine-protein kinase n=1 Tax=Aphis craccivora TaxID=307492 RepID=A0A6G0Y5J6_APHCR|nr:putative serine/threonine-protein kinase [Aphis craccivora]
MPVYVFLILFRNHFCSNNQQHSVRNELYRPHYHRDNSTLQKHAMDWINEARFLRPAIDPVEMVDQIILHYAFHISVSELPLPMNSYNNSPIFSKPTLPTMSKTISLKPLHNTKIHIIILLATTTKIDTFLVKTIIIPVHNTITIIHQLNPILQTLLRTRPARTCTVSLSNSPLISLLIHPLDLSKEIVPPPNYRPEIPIKLLNNSYNALLDSGASVSAISENLYAKLISDPSQHKIPLFPLTSIMLTTTLSNKSIKINLKFI